MLHIVDKDKFNEVLNDHGEHDYSLMILANGFTKDVVIRKNLSISTIHDYLLSSIVHISNITDLGMEDVASEILNSYNKAMKNIEDRPDLCVQIE